LGRRQSPGRRGKRISDTVRGQNGRAPGPCVHAPRETVALWWWVRSVIAGRSLHHLRPVAGHRYASGRHGDFRGSSGSGVFGAVRRTTRAHDGRTTGTGSGYAAGACDRHAAAADH